MSTTKASWWKNSVVYQVYPRSFQDSNGDGIGDLPGLIRRIPYLERLGIDLLWLCPVFASPNDDNGYDISDYQAIDPQYGTLDDMVRLIDTARRAGIRILLDLVANHTSDEHAWFQASRASRDSPFRDWYLWKDPRPDGSPPTSWRSIFGGPAWELDPATGQYYFHTFSKRQPDLNWENPQVRQAIYTMMRWWAGLGIAGFRIDAITFIKKNQAWPDPLPAIEGFHNPLEGGCCNEPGILDFLREMRDEVLSPLGVVTVAEAPGVSADQMRWYTGAEGVFSMLFTFDHVDLDLRPDSPWVYRPWSLTDWKRSMSQWQTGAQGWLGLYLENHDQVRSVSKFGASGPLKTASAKTLATWYFLMRGTPFVYQGQELGMTNAPFQSLDEYRDNASMKIHEQASAAGLTDDEILGYLALRSRDHGRTPFPWDASPNAGFTTGTPWIGVHPEYPVVNAAAAESDGRSVLAHYRALIRLRKTQPVLVDGAFAPILADSEVLGGYRRTLDGRTVTVLCNFSDQPQPVAGGEGVPVLLNSHDAFDGRVLAPWQSVVLGDSRG